jgi:hypothetical protein
VSVDVRDEAGTFIAKWRGRWPEWELAMVFVPAAQRPLVEAWYTLLQEFTDAAWTGDPTPGLAKLAWWQDELGGWAKGARRHPLGALLQAHPAPWLQLGRALPDLRALRDDAGGDAPVAPAATAGAHAGEAFAAAVADCEAVLFRNGTRGAGDAAAIRDSLFDERALLHALSMDPIGAVDRPPSASRPGTRPRGIHAALVAARLARPGAPVPPLRALFAAWRGARASG